MKQLRESAVLEATARASEGESPLGHNTLLQFLPYMQEVVLGFSSSFPGCFGASPFTWPHSGSSGVWSELWRSLPGTWEWCWEKGHLTLETQEAAFLGAFKSEPSRTPDQKFSPKGLGLEKERSGEKTQVCVWPLAKSQGSWGKWKDLSQRVGTESGNIS